MKTIDLVLKHNNSLVTILENYPYIPPVGHRYVLNTEGHTIEYEVVDTASVIDIDKGEQKNPLISEAVRVEVNPI